MPRKAICFHLGVSYKTYDNWVNGRSTFPPDLIAKLFKITKDPRIYDFLTDGTGFMAVPHSKGCSKADTKVLIASATFHLGQMIHRYRTGKKLRPVLSEGVEAIRHIRGFMERAKFKMLKGT